MLFFISILLLSQAFTIYCCISLGIYRSEIDETEVRAYEDSAQDEYVKEWNKRHKRT